VEIETRRSFCRFCHAGCAIDVDVHVGVAADEAAGAVVGERVVAVRGVVDDPMYGGYTCVKGRHLGDQHHSSTRLHRSLRRTVDGFEPTPTATALDDIADRVAAVLERHGGRALATYCGTAAYQNATGLPVARAFHQAIDSPSFYTSATIDQPAKFMAPMRHGAWLAGPQPFESADVAMVIGCNTLVSTYAYAGGLPSYNPLVRLRAAKERGLFLIVVDPRRTEMAAYADLHLQVRPGEDPTLLAGLIRQILVDDLVDHEFVDRWVSSVDGLRRAVEPFTPTYVEQRAGVPASDLIEAARRFGGAGKRGCATTGTGPNMAPHPTLTEHLTISLNTLCGRYLRAGDHVANPPGGILAPATPTKAQPTAPMSPERIRKGHPARVRDLHVHRGEAPTSALADEILMPGDGQVRALITLGGNPVVAWPDQRKTVEALLDLDLHVVVDAQVSATAELAHYVLASTLSLERPDVPTTIDRWFPEAYSNYTPAVLTPGPEMLQEWQVYTELAARLGVTMRLPGGEIEPGQRLDADDVLDLIYATAQISLDELRVTGAMLFPEMARVVEPADADCVNRLELMPDGTAEEILAVLEEGNSGAVIAGFDPQRHRFRVTSRRLKSVFNSSGREVDVLRSKAGTNFAHMHPDDLIELGITDGDVIELASPRGSIRGVVKASDDLARGTVSMAHAWGGLPDHPGDIRSYGSTTSALVDVESGFDPYTGMPVMSAIPVEIRPAVPA
jgi:anaerobic selenocysteine-containing dehydrogenase